MSMLSEQASLQKTRGHLPIVSGALPPWPVCFVLVLLARLALAFFYYEGWQAQMSSLSQFTFSAWLAGAWCIRTLQNRSAAATCCLVRQLFTWGQDADY